MSEAPEATPTEALFDPVPLRYRHDGWTPAKQWMFIQRLADCGSVDQACQMVDMTEGSAYRLRRHPDAGDFRRAWDEAIRQSWHSLDQIVIERIRFGETKIIDHKEGGSTVIRTPCSDRLLIAAMKREERRRERAEDRAEREALRAEQRAADYARAVAEALTPGRPATMPPPEPAPAPTPAETAARAAAAEAEAVDRACGAFHTLAFGLTDKPKWEEPHYIFSDDIPPIAGRERVLVPDTLRVPVRGGKLRWRSSVAKVGPAAPPSPGPRSARLSTPGQARGRLSPIKGEVKRAAVAKSSRAAPPPPAAASPRVASPGGSHESNTFVGALEGEDKVGRGGNQSAQS